MCFLFLIFIYLLDCIRSYLQHSRSSGHHERSFREEHRLSSCDTGSPEHTGSVFGAQGFSCSVACGILVPWPGIEPASCAMQGKFLTTGTPGKSLAGVTYKHQCTFQLSAVLLWAGKSLLVNVKTPDIFARWDLISMKGKDKSWYIIKPSKSFPHGSMVMNLPANERNVGSISKSGRSPGKGNSNSLQYSCLGNPMDRDAWQATIHVDMT